MVSQMEPEVHEVPRLFRTVLRDCMDEVSGNEDIQTPNPLFEKQQRSKSLSFVTFRTKFRSGQMFKGSGMRGSRGNLQQQVDWSDDEDDEDMEEEAIKVRASKGRSRSMPEITPLEQSAQAWEKGGSREGRGCRRTGARKRRRMCRSRGVQWQETEWLIGEREGVYDEICSKPSLYSNLVYKIEKKWGGWGYEASFSADGWIPISF